MPRKRSAKPTDADFRGDQSSEPLLMKGEPEVSKPTLINGSKRMPIIDPSQWNLDDLPDLKILPAGTEVKVRITSVDFGTDKSGNDFFNVWLDVPDEPLVKEFNYFMNIPTMQIPDKRRDVLYRSWKEFAICFGLDFTGPTDPTADWSGAEGWVILGVEKGTGRYGDKNSISRCVLPQ